MSVGWGKKPKTGKWLICTICGKRFYRKLVHIKRSKVLYCSKKCFNKSKKGKIPPNFEQIRSYFEKGKNNISWKGGISSLLYPIEWNGTLKHKIFVRDKGRCQLCGKLGRKRSDLVCHHIDFNKKNCQTDNIQLLCRSCHMKVHWKANKGVPGLKNYKFI